MSVDVAGWMEHRQQSEVCILVSYGLAASCFTGVTPAAIFASYCAGQGLSVFPPATAEQGAACAFRNQMVREGHATGYALLDSLHVGGTQPFATVEASCTLEAFQFAVSGAATLVDCLTHEPAVAIVCINWIASGMRAAHSVAVAADRNGDFWRNDPNGGKTLLPSLTEVAVCSGYDHGTVGDVRLLKARTLNAPSVAAPVAGSRAGP